jgi:hypothetical protein
MEDGRREREEKNILIRPIFRREGVYPPPPEPFGRHKAIEGTFPEQPNDGWGLSPPLHKKCKPSVNIRKKI